MGKKNKQRKQAAKQARRMVTPTVAALLGAAGAALFLRRDRVKPFMDRKFGRDNLGTAQAAE